MHSSNLQSKFTPSFFRHTKVRDMVELAFKPIMLSKKATISPTLKLELEGLMNQVSVKLFIL